MEHYGRYVLVLLDFIQVIAILVHTSTLCTHCICIFSVLCGRTEFDIQPVKAAWRQAASTRLAHLLGIPHDLKVFLEINFLHFAILLILLH